MSTNAESQMRVTHEIEVNYLDMLGLDLRTSAVDLLVNAMSTLADELSEQCPDLNARLVVKMDLSAVDPAAT